MKSTILLPRTNSQVVTLALIVSLLQFAMSSTASDVQDRTFRMEYRMSEAMPDSIALRMLLQRVSISEDDDPRLTRSAKAGTSLSDADVTSLVEYLMRLQKKMKADLDSQLYSVACDSVNSRASNRRAAMTLDILDDVRLTVYEKYYHFARADLSDAQFAGLQSWLKEIKKSAVYGQIDHVARYSARPSSDAMQALNTFCAGRGAQDVF